MKTALRLTIAVVGMAVFFVSAVRVQAQFHYTNDNGSMTITGYNGPGGAVTIPDIINGLPVTSIGREAFKLSITNPWMESVERWKRENDPAQLQEAANKRAEARKRQKDGDRMAKADKEASEELAKQVAEAMKRTGC